MSRPEVSVVIPTYNRADLLPRALDSVCAQTYDDLEIIVVDDGSTDRTPDSVAPYARRFGDRFRYIRQPRAGCGPARNRGIDASRGRFVAFLDSDDEYLPTKLERQIELFTLRPDLGLVYCDFACIDLDGKRHQRVFDALLPGARRVPCARIGGNLCICGESMFDYLLAEYFVATICGVVRREVLGSGIRWRAVPSYSEEWLFFLKVARSSRAGFVDEPLCLHHFTAGSITRTDRRRNSARLVNLFPGMLRELAPLEHRQRRIIRNNLAHVCDQIGFDAFREGRFFEASRYLLRSFRNRPELRTIGRATRATWRLVAGPGRACPVSPKAECGTDWPQTEKPTVP